MMNANMNRNSVACRWGQIEQQQQHWEHQQTQVQAVKQQIQQLNQQLTFLKNAQLQQQLNAYNQQVQQLNQQGGASATQRSSLNQQRRNLNSKPPVYRLKFNSLMYVLQA